MKSAYELAMERLGASDPQVKLTEAQRAEIAEVENRFKAKIAEREVFLKGLMDQARGTGNYGELQELQIQLARDLATLNSDREAAKQKIREQASGQ
ncbi:MAG: competence protein ComEC [Verrucomicrobia bacterium]|jgi:hypothetical protein|nr:MAG: competence protein ComEC [Verrucomicrobiota bacterium]